MSETKYAETKTREEYDRPNELPKVRSYAWLGVLVLVCLIATYFMAIFQVHGPSQLTPTAAFWAIGICIAVLAFALLVLSFTLHSAMREARDQGLAITRLEVRMMEDQYHQQVQHAEATNTVLAPQGASRPVEIVEGIGPTYASRLNEIGVFSLEDLRNAEEQQVQAATGARAATVNDWVAMANLMRIRQLSPQGAELLCRAGCRDLATLAGSDPDNLYRRLRRANEAGQKRIYPDVLHGYDVRTWVAAAQVHTGNGYHQKSLAAATLDARAAEPAPEPTSTPG